MVRLGLDGSVSGVLLVHNLHAYPQGFLSAGCTQTFDPVSRLVVHRAQSGKTRLISVQKGKNKRKKTSTKMQFRGGDQKFRY